MTARRALAGRTLAQSRVMTVSFAILVVAYAAANVIGYRQNYPTTADRIGLAESFGTNSSLRLFYGEPHDLLTTSGYVEWRVGGFLAIVFAVLGVVGSVRALRSEEESGRLELVLTGRLTRAGALAAALAAVALMIALVSAALSLTLLVTHLPAAGAIWLGLGEAATALVFAGVGALAGQVLPTRRATYAAAGLVLAGTFLLRVVADTGSGMGWVRWTTPLGWTEQLRPFTGARPAVLLLHLALAALLGAAAAAIAVGRDVGTGLVRSRDTAAPSCRLLGSVAGAALRDETVMLASWLSGTAAFAFVVGSLSGSIADALSADVRKRLEQLGAADIIRPDGFLAFYFVFFVLAVSLFFCAQVGAARHEEAEQRLETLLSLPLGRLRWLGSRLGVAACSGLALALVAGLAAWAGARANGIDIALGGVLEAGLNILPTGLLFLGLASLLLGVVPRASTGLAYGLVAVAFLWELVGAVVGAPSWLIGLSPFHHVGLVPIRPYPFAAASIMIAIGVIGAAAGAAAFRRRDLTGA